MVYSVIVLFFFQAEDGIRDLVRSRGLGDVYKRQGPPRGSHRPRHRRLPGQSRDLPRRFGSKTTGGYACLLYTSDAADERSSVDLGGRRIIKKKTTVRIVGRRATNNKNKKKENRVTQ